MVPPPLPAPRLLVHLPQGGATTAAPQQQAIRFADNAPTWEELQAAVEAKQQALDAVPPPLETVRAQWLLGVGV